MSGSMGQLGRMERLNWVISGSGMPEMYTLLLGTRYLILRPHVSELLLESSAGSQA